MSGSLSKDELIELLHELSERLERKKTRASIYIVGDAAMALAFDRSRTTHDIDGRIDTGHGALVEAVHEIAHRRGLPTSWLNDQATPKMPMAPDRRARTLYASEYLTVSGASGEHILGMKLESGRAFDQKDVITLARHLKGSDDGRRDRHPQSTVSALSQGRQSTRDDGDRTEGDRPGSARTPVGENCWRYGLQILPCRNLNRPPFVRAQSP